MIAITRRFCRSKGKKNATNKICQQGCVGVAATIFVLRLVCCLFFPCSVSYECASANNDQAIIAL